MSPAGAGFVRLPSLKSVAEFRDHVAALGLDLPCEDAILKAPGSPLSQPIPTIRIAGKFVGNRIAVQPMEGWDGTRGGGPSPDTVRRWTRFGESGAKLICGGEAMAVRMDGRANPNQLVINRTNQAGLKELLQALLKAHRTRYGSTEDLVVGFQLTHSGRFCRPTDHAKLEPRVAFRHPLLDQRFGVTSDAQVFSDAELEALTLDYIEAARIAREVGADFVDIKHCHGYLLHELLGAFTRPGRYGGSFENRTRMLRDIVAGIRASGNPIDIAVRLSAFDTVPFRPDPARSTPGKPGPGVPAEFAGLLPYRYAFGADPANPLAFELTEPARFIELCSQLGVKILNLSSGSPYYNPHIQRPAAYPPSDGYQPPEDPLVGVARQVGVARRLKASTAPGMIVVGSAYSYLQEFLPHVGQYVVRHGWTDVIGIGRMVLSYPGFCADLFQAGALQPRWICRTFSDCTTAPRNGMISGCYPLDRYYAGKPEATRLKQLKKVPETE